MAGIAIKIEDLERAKYHLNDTDGTIFGVEDKFYFVTKWTQELADALYSIDYELVLFNDPDSLMLQKKIEEQLKLRNEVVAAFGALGEEGEEECMNLWHHPNSKKWECKSNSHLLRHWDVSAKWLGNEKAG